LLLTIYSDPELYKSSLNPSLDLTLVQATELIRIAQKSFVRSGTARAVCLGRG